MQERIILKYKISVYDVIIYFILSNLMFGYFLKRILNFTIIILLLNKIIYNYTNNFDLV